MSQHHPLEGLAGVLREDLRHPPRQRQHLARVDLDVGRRPAVAGGALVDHHLRVRERHPLPGRAAGEDHRGRGHAHPDADRAHVRLDVLHRVVDRHAGVGRAAGRVDVERRCPCPGPPPRGRASARRSRSRSRRRPRGRGRRSARAAGGSRCRTSARSGRRTRRPSGSAGSQRLLPIMCNSFGCITIRNLTVARRGGGRGGDAGGGGGGAARGGLGRADRAGAGWRSGSRRTARSGSSWSRRSRRGAASPTRWDEGRVAIELEEVETGTRVVVTETGEPGWNAVFALRALATPTLERRLRRARRPDPAAHRRVALARRRRSATQLAAELPVTRQAVAKHLTALREAGLVESRKQGRETLYRVNTDAARRRRRLDRAGRRRVGRAARTAARPRRARAVGEHCFCALDVAPLHAEPDASSEQVTQALRGEPLDGRASGATAGRA